MSIDKIEEFVMEKIVGPVLYILVIPMMLLGLVVSLVAGFAVLFSLFGGR